MNDEETAQLCAYRTFFPDTLDWAMLPAGERPPQHAIKTMEIPLKSTVPMKQLELDAREDNMTTVIILNEKDEDLVFVWVGQWKVLSAFWRPLTLQPGIVITLEVVAINDASEIPFNEIMPITFDEEFEPDPDDIPPNGQGPNGQGQGKGIGSAAVSGGDGEAPTPSSAAEHKAPDNDSRPQQDPTGC